MNTLLKPCQSILSNHRRFLANAGLMAVAELVNRLTRIAAAIALAWTMSIVEFGIAAAALTVHELVRLLVQNGLGTRIVVAAPRDLAATATAVHRLNWLVGFAMALVQCLLAWLIGLHFADSRVALAIATMAVVHIIYPAAMVQVYLAQREDRWKTVSLAVAAQCGTDNLLTAALALTGFGLWSIVIPKLIVAPMWVLWHRAVTPWQPLVKPKADQYRGLVVFGAQVFAAEALSGLRHHVDKLLVGAVLGPAALGIYAFAANVARIGLISLTTAMAAVILPRLRDGIERGDGARVYRRSVAEMMFVIAPVATALALAAPWIIPFCFGEKWEPAVPIVIIVALFTIVHPVFVATSQLLRATQRGALELKISMVSAAVFLVSFSIGLSAGVAVAAAVAGLAQLALAVALFVIMQRGEPEEHALLATNGATS